MNEFEKKERFAWYVLRVTYQRELAAQEQLEEQGIRTYVPLKRVRKMVKGRLVWKVEAALHNYIFVYINLKKIKEIKTRDIPYLRYVMGVDSDGQRRPQYVPDRQMESFIAITSQETEKIKYLDPDFIDLKVGDRVRVLDGPFKGCEGVYMRTSGRHEKRVVVKIMGLVAVATPALKSASVEKIEDVE
jgi:transcription antitermination factor NusG